MPARQKEPTEPASASDPFNTATVLKLVIRKIASQSLLFGIAVIVVLAGAWEWFGRDALPLIAAVLFVFTAALAGYLFVEQKARVARRDPATMHQINASQMKDITNPAGEFHIELWTAPAPAAGARDISVAARQKTAGYKIGQKIVVGFRASRDCYLTLLNIGTSGKLTVLYPNSMHPENYITGGREYRLPEIDDEFEYQLQGPAGVEKLKAIATLNKVTLLESSFAPDGSLFRTVDAVAGARDIALIQRNVAAVSKSEWAESACEFSVS